jgi:hypothetical protein
MKRANSNLVESHQIKTASVPQTPNLYAALAGDTTSLTGPQVKPKAKPNRRRKPKKGKS